MLTDVLKSFSNRSYLFPWSEWNERKGFKYVVVIVVLYRFCFTYFIWYQRDLFTCQLVYNFPELGSSHVFLFAFIMGYRLFWRSVDSSLGNVWITGDTEFVGALFGCTICDHPLKSLLIYCGCLFSEIPSLCLGTASILISQLGLSKRESNLQNEATQQINHGNVRIYWDRNRGANTKANTSLNTLFFRYFGRWHAPPPVRKQSQE